MRPETAFKHATKLYEELVKVAQQEDGVLTFRGSKTAAYSASGLPRSYYSDLFNLLTELGCAEPKTRGAVTAPSVMILHRPPESVEQVESVYARRPLTKRESPATLREDLDELKRRVPPIDLNRYILSFDNRLTELEARVSRLENKGDEVAS